MLVVGAGGLVLQMLDDLVDQFGDRLSFWTNLPLNNKYLEGKFPIITSDSGVDQYYRSQGNDFIIAVGNPQNRALLSKRFESLGGNAFTFISSKTIISQYSSVGKGSVILHGTIIEAGAVLDKGVLVNSQVTITHEVRIGEFSEIGPGVTLAGKVSIGKECFIGSGATIIPGMIVGDKAVVGAGAVVIENIPEKDTVIGVPAKSVRK